MARLARAGASAAGELAAIEQVMAAQWWSRDRIDEHTRHGVRAMVDHARRTVPWYRSTDPAVPATLADLAALPVLRKADLIEDPRRFHSVVVPAGDLLVTRTSGTSGQRLEVAHDRRAYAYHNAACLRRFLATGHYRPWYRLAHLRPFPMPTRWYQRVGLFRRTNVICSRPPEEILQLVRRVRPQALIGYPTMLREFVRIAPPDDLARLRRSLRLVFTESELLLPVHRQQLRDLLGVPVFDEYSAYEVLNVTFECREGGTHVSEDRVYVEIVNDHGSPVPPGEEGEVVVTHYLERGMPLIRYALGDLGILQPGSCPCGRTFRRLRLTRGRAVDHVVLPDGSLLYAATFLFLAAEHPGVAESSVHQAADGTITVSLVPATGSESREEVARTYVERLHELSGRRFDVGVRWVDRVEITPGGKGRFLTRDLSA